MGIYWLPIQNKDECEQIVRNVCCEIEQAEDTRKFNYYFPIVQKFQI